MYIIYFYLLAIMCDLYCTDDDDGLAVDRLSLPCLHFQWFGEQAQEDSDRFHRCVT